MLPVVRKDNREFFCLFDYFVGTGVLDCPLIETIFTAKRYVCS